MNIQLSCAAQRPARLRHATLTEHQRSGRDNGATGGLGRTRQHLNPRLHAAELRLLSSAEVPGNHADLWSCLKMPRITRTQNKRSKHESVSLQYDRMKFTREGSGAASREAPEGDCHGLRCRESQQNLELPGMRLRQVCMCMLPVSRVRLRHTAPVAAYTYAGMTLSLHTGLVLAAPCGRLSLLRR